MLASAQPGASVSEGSGTAAVPDPVSRAGKRRGWRTVSLRGLMLLVVLAAFFFARETNLARRQKHAVDSIIAAGGTVAFDDVIGPDGNVRKAPPLERPAWQRWVMSTLGDDYIRQVYGVHFNRSSQPSKRSVGPRPEFWSALADLHDAAALNLVRMNVTDPDLAVIGRLHELHHLDLQENPGISDPGMAHLENLPKLDGIQLYGTSVGDEGIRHLKGCSHLRYLSVQGTHVSDATLALLAQWPELNTLDFSGTQITDAGMVHLRGLKSLGGLLIDNTRITDAGLASIADLKTLGTLNLKDTPTADTGMAHLAGLSRLAHLSLGRGVTDKSLPILKKMKSLRMLDVTSSQISPEGCEELRKAFPTTTNIIR